MKNENIGNKKPENFNNFIDKNKKYNKEKHFELLKYSQDLDKQGKFTENEDKKNLCA